MKTPETGMGTPEQHIPEQKEIKWVYTMTVPHEQGEPNISIVIGVPENSNVTGWLFPEGFEKENLNYQIDVPLNVIIDNQRIECVAKGTVLGDVAGNKFSLQGIEAKEVLPEGAGEAIKKASERVLDPAQNKTVQDAVSQEIERQCRNYFNAQRKNK